MYQILSLNDNKEYVITEDEWSANDYTKYTVMEFKSYYERELFQTLLDFLNSDYHKKAVDSFIDDICRMSKNAFLIEEQKNRRENINLVLSFAFSMFPNEERRKHVYELKRPRKKGMTINKTFEQRGIEQEERHLCSIYRKRIHHIALLSEYIDMIGSEETLNNPLVFRLFINEFIKTNNYSPLMRYYSDDIRISTATPLIMELSNVKNMKLIDFAEITKTVCFNDEYDKYIIKTIDTACGHDRNPFEEGNELGELNIAMSDIYFILQHGWEVKKCANCGKYFVNRNRTDIKYCSNPAPLDATKTCREYAATRGYYIERKNDELEGLRGKVKNRLNKRTQRDPLCKEQYNKFNEIDKKWRSVVKENSNQYVEYLQWLNSVEKITKSGGGKIENAVPKPYNVN